MLPNTKEVSIPFETKSIQISFQFLELFFVHSRIHRVKIIVFFVETVQIRIKPAKLACSRKWAMGVEVMSLLNVLKKFRNRRRDV